MSEIAKRLEKADKYLQKGKLPLALEELRLVLQEDPNNDFARQRAADLATSLGAHSEAVGYVGELFDHSVAQGRSPDAIAQYKKLQRMGAVDMGRTFHYAQLIEKSSPREALESFRSCFEPLLAKGRKEDALLAIKKMVLLEPSVENLQREAELAEQLGDRESAATCLLQLGKLEENAGRDGSQLFSRAYALDSRNPVIVLEHARCLVREQHAEDAVKVLQGNTMSSPEYMELLAQAYLMANQIGPAEPVVTKLYNQSEKSLHLVGEVLDAYARNHQVIEAVRYARSAESRAKARGTLREFLTLVREICDKYPGELDLLEYVAQLYNSSNREHEYCATLLKLFELYYAQRNFVKAADCLDRASEVDAYEPGHEERLAMLRGKIDANRYNAIENRISTVARKTAKLPSAEEEQPTESLDQQSEQGGGEPTVLEDLMLQAEIFLQYSMRSKAVERLERINKLFPHEEEQREKLAQLYFAAGFVPKYEEAKAGVAAATASERPNVAAANESAVDNFARVTEITRNIARQSSVKAVLFATVNDVGRHWNVSRCVAGLCSPGKPPSAAMEYCATGVTKSDVMGLAKLLPALQTQTGKANGPISFERAQSAQELESIRPVLAAQKIDSLLTVPLIDGEEPIGLVILEQCGGTRAFRNVDEVVLNTISEQVVMAVNNARLRSLVKNMAATDENSGLMRRSSYLDVLLAEVQRSLPQRAPISLVLMNFGSASALVKEVGEDRVDEAMREIGQVVTAHIRQNDIAVRYDLTSIVLVLSDTNDKNAFFVLDKLRKVLVNSRMPGGNEPVMVRTGIAELVMQPKFDPVDIVTEGINRVEAALETAKHEGGDGAHSMAANYETSMVGAY
jgi:diguanylate cyclase (GGDEF)-like protein